MSKSNVNPDHYKVAGRERQGENIVQIRHKQKHARNLIAARSAPHARRERPALIPGPPPGGAAPLGKVSSTAAKKKTAANKNKGSTKKQGSETRGKRSTGRKRARQR